MEKIELTAITQRKVLKYNMIYSEFHTVDIAKYAEKERFDFLCKKGCPNYNKKWSCPPFSPNYINYTSTYEYINIVILTISMNQFEYIKNDYVKIKAANTILKSRIDKVLRSCIDNGVYYISNGSCRLCKPCKCKINQVCSHPDLMTYSFESLGINVSNMLKDLFDFDLQWYSKGSIPSYTSVISGVLYNSNFDMNIIEDTLAKLK